LKVLYVGSGAVNLCLAGWMHSGTSSTSFLVRTADNKLIETQEFECSFPGEQISRVYKCKAFATLDSQELPDLIVFGVKSYSLETAIDAVLKAFGKQIPVMSVLNGVRHIEVLTDKFPNVLFATIAFNSYRVSQTSAVAVGESLGLSGSGEDTKMLEAVHEILEGKINLKLVAKPSDAAHTKLVLNLGNALLTIVGFHDNRNRELDTLQPITAKIMWEGVQVMKRHGIKEARIPGMPPWILLWLSKTSPTSIILPIFKKKMKSTSINSMAQDLQKGSDTTELEDINGYLVQLADKLSVEIPYNRALYQIFKEWQKEGAQPIKPSVLLSQINSFSNR
jgi:2-dehydropantoate 2-reductase